MGRFDREEASAGLPASLDTATESLHATLEVKLREIVEAAEARAHELEDRALEQALEVEQDSERKAREQFESAAARTEEVRAGIDRFEREIADAIGLLRRRGEALIAELDSAMGREPAVEEREEETVEPPPATTGEVASPDEERENVRRRILDLFLAGKGRSEAERLLRQIEDGGRYTDLLDEVYESRSGTQQGSRRSRGGRRRRRPGSP